MIGVSEEAWLGILPAASGSSGDLLDLAAMIAARPKRVAGTGQRRPEAERGKTSAANVATARLVIPQPCRGR